MTMAYVNSIIPVTSAPTSIKKMDEPFPRKLYRMLEEAQVNGNQDVLSWSSDGKSFTIHEPKVFADTLMKAYFRQTKYKSFQRQLNLYGFKREVNGKKRGNYNHPLFVRNEHFLVSKIKRVNRPRTSAALSSSNSLSNQVASFSRQQQHLIPRTDQTTYQLLPTEFPTMVPQQLANVPMTTFGYSFPSMPAGGFPNNFMMGSKPERFMGNVSKSPDDNDSMGTIDGELRSEEPYVPQETLNSSQESSLSRDGSAFEDYKPVAV